MKTPPDLETMDEGVPPSPQPSPPGEGEGSGSMGKGPEFCVPLDSLSMPDDKDQMTPPEVGDVVNAQVEGKVSRIEGENAYVVATSINGKPIGEEEAAEPSPEDQDQAQLAELQDMAQKQGAMS